MTMRVSFKLIAVLAIVSLIAFASASASSSAAPAPPMTVVLHQKSGLPISYFQLQARRGRQASVGTLELRNRGPRRVTVLLDPIDAVTASTLGSAYDVRGLSLHGPARWTRLSHRRIVLAPRGVTSVAVAVLAPGTAIGGDYLSGIGVQAVASPQQTKLRANVAISSTERYAIGLEVRLPGPRHPLIDLTGASIARDPAGIAFAIDGRNAGNVILQNVHGSALITQGRRVVARVVMGPGTFVTGTSLAYPIPTPREQPQQGSSYRVKALLNYGRRTAVLDTLVHFGHRDALRQQAFGGPKAPSRSSSFPVLPVGIAVALLALMALGAALLWPRRAGRLPALPTLERALTAARLDGHPLSLISLHGGQEDSAGLAALVRARLRRTDRLCHLDDQAILVVAPDTDAVSAHALAADIRRHLERTESANSVVIEVHAVDPALTSNEVLGQATRSSAGALLPIPAS